MRSLEQIKLSVSDFPSFIAFSLRGYLQTRCDNFRAGCVSHSSDAWKQLTSDQDCWFSHDVTKFQTSELLILLRFYFHDVLEQLKTNIQTNFHSEWVLGLVIDYA